MSKGAIPKEIESHDHLKFKNRIFAIESSSCLGQCGNGPMVLILPEEIWYSQVQPNEVRAVVERHLQGGILIKRMLYPKFHPQ